MRHDRAPSALPDQASTLHAVARNLSTRYLAIGIESIVGLVLLPLNIQALGQATYGIWMLAASVTGYFSVLDLGYAGALTRFVARYRARRDPRAINEIVSTLFLLFLGVGVITVIIGALVALSLGALFRLSPEDAAVGRTILLIVSVQVGCGLAFSVFGGVVNGFQRFDLNNVVGAATALLVGLVNVVVVTAGFGVIALVVSTTTVRLVAFLVYRRNAYRVFPELSVSPRHARTSRLREITGFSVFMAVLDWAAKVNYAVDTLVIGAFLGPVFVATWTVSQRLAEAIQRLTNQLNDVLFPAVVDSDATDGTDRLRAIFLQATRLSLATVLPVAVTAALLAEPLLAGWVGAGTGSVAVTRVLAAVVILRVGTATSMTVLKGAGGHRLLSAANVVTAAVNLTLSVILVRTLGLPGVALGTLLPVGLTAVTVIFPAACRRAGVGVSEAVRQAVWPAVWPALVMALWLAAAVRWVPPSLSLVAVHSLVAGSLYLVLFLRWGLPATERRAYVVKAASVLSKLRHMEATS